jgi:nitroimidazol reductase NimA-like FMN-containing flavoprotein (pyridoxamine 5'-phosphate oxidase superfamily)
MTDPEIPRDDTMTQDEIVEFLQNQGHGVLSVGDQSDVYGVPISFGYTEEENSKVIYMYLNQFGEGSKKLELTNRTDRASVVVYDIKSREKWRSVILMGRLKNLGTAGESVFQSEKFTEQYIRNIMKENAWFPLFSEEGEQINESRIFFLLIDEMTGRQSEAYL